MSFFSFVESSLKIMSYDGGGGDPWHDKFDPYGPAKWKYRKSSLSHIVDRIVLIDSPTCYLHFFKCGWKETDALNGTQSCRILIWLIYLVLLLCRWDRTELICNVKDGRWNWRGWLPPSIYQISYMTLFQPGGRLRQPHYCLNPLDCQTFLRLSWNVLRSCWKTRPKKNQKKNHPYFGRSVK